MFFPYHSWIDVQLEMKIRMCDTPIQGKAMFEKLSKNIQKQRFDPILDPHDKRKQLGEYPLIEWCDPRFGRMERSLSFAQKIEKCKELNLTPNSLKTYFNAHGFYLKNSLELRKTYQLKEFYD